MIEESPKPNKLYEIVYCHTFSNDQTNYVRAVSIQAAIDKWTERGEGYHEEKDIISIRVMCFNIDDYKVIYWD